MWEGKRKLTDTRRRAARRRRETAEQAEEISERSGLKQKMPDMSISLTTLAGATAKPGPYSSQRQHFIGAVMSSLTLCDDLLGGKGRINTGAAWEAV